MKVKCDHRSKFSNFKQLERRSLKKIRASTGFEPMTMAREAPKITFPNEKNHGILNGIEMGEAFLFKTPSSIMIKTCFTESLLLDHLEELFVNPPQRFIIATGCGKMNSKT